MYNSGADRLLSTLLVVGTALAQAQISATVADSISTALLPAWAAFFAALSGLMTFALAIVFWLLMTGMAHIICVVLDGRGSYARFVVGAGYGYLPYFLTTLFTLAGIVEISPQISVAVASGELIGAPLRARLSPYGMLNSAAQLLLFGWVAIAAWRVHDVTAVTATMSVAAPVGVVLTTRAVLAP